MAPCELPNASIASREANEVFTKKGSCVECHRRQLYPNIEKEQFPRPPFERQLSRNRVIYPLITTFRIS